MCYNTRYSQVPDHQEVFVDRLSDMSLIVELLSYEEGVADDQAAIHYFEDLAHCNEVRSKVSNLTLCEIVCSWLWCL
jgi:hypothetical protein